MIVTLTGGCRVADMHDGRPVVNGTLQVWKQFGQAQGARAISLRVMQFAPGRSPLIRNGQSDEILYVLDQPAHGFRTKREAGENRSQAPAEIKILIDGISQSVGPDTGIYLRPGQTIAVDNPGPEAVNIISSQCPDPGLAPEFVEAFDSSNTQPTDKPGIVRLADQRAQPTGDRWYRVLVDDAVGCAQVTQFVGSIPPGRAPDHFHHYEEVLFILKGAGRMWAGETKTPIAPGSCIYLPKGQVHCVENTGDDELRLLGMFYPAGSPSVRYEA